ncbi:MAG: hypothetical protein KGY69_07095 [Bacteroidales bacterium]|nr:hypothetical protein [Bacteroidales bacterium]
MTPRERVQKAINHQIPDRVPIDLGGFQTGIHKKAYKDLIDYLGYDEEINIMDPVQQLAQPSEDVLKRFNVDLRYINAHGPEGFDGSIQQNWRNGKLWHDLEDEFGVVWSMPDDQNLYMDLSHHPLANATIEDVKHYPFPKGDDPTRFTGVREEVLKLRNETNYAISTGIIGVIYETCWYLRGLEQWFMDMLTNEAFCSTLLDHVLEFWKGFVTEFMKAVGDSIDVVMIGDDIAGQNGALFSPDFYRRIVKPRQKELVQHIKSLTPAKVWYHTCGSCVEYIPDLIEIGVDILNPVQTSANNMDPKALKEKYGDQIVFWGGGIDSQHILPFADPDQVRDEVRKNLDIFKPGGGYVFNNIHNIQAGISPENIVALYDAAYEYGFY